MRALPLVLLIACGAPAPVATEVVVGTEVDAWVEGGGSGSVLIVQVSAPSEAAWSLPEPTAQGLTFGAREERAERVGDRTVTTRRWAFQGPPGSYVLDALCARVAGDDGPPPCAPPLYVDIGVQPDRRAMVDIVEPPATWPEIPWTLVGALAAAAGLGAVGLGLLLRRPAAPALDPVDEEPPDVAALRRWEAVRDDPALSDHDKALALSEIFRAYVEAVLHFPARSWTTTETLAHLERLDALPKLNLPRARRLLRATDRVKYADATPAEHFFADLEADLHAFVDQTRPRSWRQEDAS